MPSSLILRSLKFLHGLPQVSSRTVRISACYAWSARIVALREATSGKRGERKYVHIYWIFSIIRRRRCARLAGESRDSPHLGDDEMPPPMFAAGLIRGSDLESTVTILQQDLRRCWSRTRWSEAPRTHRALSGPGNHRGPLAKELGKRWRFFPTYAEV